MYSESFHTLPIGYFLTDGNCKRLPQDTQKRGEDTHPPMLHSLHVAPHNNKSTARQQPAVQEQLTV